jgi:hypothetical protein
MVTERGRRIAGGASTAAVCAVAPLVGAEVWSGFRFGLADPVLGTIAASEQALSVRSPTGLWAMGVALLWFVLAYRGRTATWWEGALVLLGATAVVVRVGNAWLMAIAIVMPLARQLAYAQPRASRLAAGAAVAVGVSVFTVVTTRPPGLPATASQAAVAAARQMVGAVSATSQAAGAVTVGAASGAPSGGATVFADWRWAAGLSSQLAGTRSVLPAGGIASESKAFWLDYARIAQGYDRWAELLQGMHVDLLVLDADGQMRRTADLVRTSSDWRVLYDADGALVAERATSP